jgi:hypothetical protein
VLAILGVVLLIFLMRYASTICIRVPGTNAITSAVGSILRKSDVQIDTAYIPCGIAGCMDIIVFRTTPFWRFRGSTLISVFIKYVYIFINDK